jgi:hypothetical protein
MPDRRRFYMKLMIEEYGIAAAFLLLGGAILRMMEMLLTMIAGGMP